MGGKVSWEGRIRGRFYRRDEVHEWKGRSGSGGGKGEKTDERENTRNGTEVEQYQVSFSTCEIDRFFLKLVLGADRGQVR